MSLTDAITRLADQVVWVGDEVAHLHAENAKLRAALEPLLAGAVEEYMLSLPENLRTKYGQLMRRLIRDAAVALNMTPRKNRGAEPSPTAAERATGHGSADGDDDD